MVIFASVESGHLSFMKGGIPGNQSQSHFFEHGIAYVLFYFNPLIWISVMFNMTLILWGVNTLGWDDRVHRN